MVERHNLLNAGAGLIDKGQGKNRLTSDPDRPLMDSKPVASGI
jgi:hypothetical protein